MKNILGLLSILLATNLLAQTGNGYQFGSVDASAQFTIGTDFNHQDATILGRIGFYDKFNLWSVGGEFGMRPFRKNIEVKEADNFYIQYREIRTVMGGFVEKKILPFEFGSNQKFGFVLGTSVGGQFANFAGIKEGNWNFWIAPYAGFTFNFENNFFVDFGYRYDNTQNDLSAHKVFVTLTGIL